MTIDNIFDDSYVGTQKTVAGVEKKSDMKAFLKAPVSNEDINIYGSSKPKRKLLRAIILNDQG